MNYAGFLRPAWTWLRGARVPSSSAFWGIPVGLPTLPGTASVATMRAFRAGLPWESVLHSWTLLDSHDTARFRTVAGSRERQLVGIGLQLTTPGVPMIFAGDEIGLEGDWGEDARRTMPWEHPETWDTELLEAYRGLIALRRGSDALARGGIRYAHVGADAIAYLRETAGERLLCRPRAPRTRPSACRWPCSAPRRWRRSSARTRRTTQPRSSSRGRPGVPSLEAPPMKTEGGRRGRGDAERGRQGLRQRLPRRPTSRWRSRTGSSSSSSGRPAAARRRRCGWSRDWADLGRDRRDRRPRGELALAEGARHRDGLPELRALPAPLGRRQHRLRPPPPQDASSEISKRVAWAAKMLDLTPTSIANRSSSPAGSASGSRWGGRSFASPRCS